MMCTCIAAQQQTHTKAPRKRPETLDQCNDDASLYVCQDYAPVSNAADKRPNLAGEDFTKTEE
jgi:hypothetical protein